MQKLKSFFTLLGVMIGVMFLIAVVSIVEGMGQYMEDDLVGKLIAVNSFKLRQQARRQRSATTTDATGRNGSAVRGSRTTTSPGRWRRFRRRARAAVVSEDNLTVESRYVAKPKQVDASNVT